MRRVVISGIGVVSCLGNSQDDVVASLKAGRSGISFNEGFRELGLRSQKILTACYESVRTEMVVEVS